MKTLENLNKVERVLFNTAERFYLKLGKTQEEATQFALEDVARKMDIEEDEIWMDLTTGKQVTNLNF